MKKILVLMASLLFIGSNAFALQFDLDLSTIDSTYGTYTDIFRINVDGFANVDQSFGVDGIFNDGDTFTEMTLLQEISYKNSLYGSNLYFNGLNTNNKVMYLYAEGLTGAAYNVTGSTLANTTFDYNFDAGIGTIGIYIDDNTGTLAHNAGTAELVGSFSLTTGDGAAKDGFLGGLENAGTTRLSAEFLAATPDDVWLTTGLDLGDLPAGYTAFGELNTTNQVIGEPALYGARYIETDNGPVLIGYDGFTSVINSTGHMSVNVVPEPSTFILLGFGLAGLGFFSRRRKS